MMELIEVPVWPVLRRGLVTAAPGSLESYVSQTSELPEFSHAPSKLAVIKRLRNRLVPEDKDLWKAEPEAKVRAMTQFDKGYLATEQVARYTYALISTYVDCMQSRHLDNPRYRRFFYSFQEAAQGRGPIPSRESLDTLTGVNFVITGRSQLGRTAYIQRLRNLFGSPFRVEGASLGSVKLVWYFPVVVLKWPDCGTLAGLLEQIREKLVSEIKDPADLTPVFRKMRGNHAATAVMAASVLLNIGIFVIDGATADSLNGRVREILGFLCRLQGHTNIPLLFSCSDVFMQGAKQLGPDVDAVLRGRSLAFEPFNAPPPDVVAVLRGRGNVEVSNADLAKLGLWYQFNLWFWRAGILSPLLEMPLDLPKWTHELCHGRIGWLAAGFRELHDSLAWDTSLLNGGGPSESAVRENFGKALRNCAAARTAITEYTKDPASVSRSIVRQHLDHLPFDSDSMLNGLLSQPKLGVGHV
ncbi:hypothetical protein [Paraburkholderia sediminicola]|uniref:hypothetical protein n=1 Tax=Paraburkholderia sediminicola TaxID=458836 RepID=UPI0038BC77A5